MSEATNEVMSEAMRVLLDAIFQNYLTPLWFQTPSLRSSTFLPADPVRRTRHLGREDDLRTLPSFEKGGNSPVSVTCSLWLRGDGVHLRGIDKVYTVLVKGLRQLLDSLLESILPPEGHSSHADSGDDQIRVTKLLILHAVTKAGTLLHNGSGGGGRRGGSRSRHVLEL